MLWLRWSWRDLRARWLQVVAIAFMVALGSGVYSGLESTAAWQEASYDTNFARLRMHDLRVTLAQGSFVDASALTAAVRSIPRREALTAVEPRLVVPTQVDVSTRGEAIVVPGRLVGIDVAAGGPRVDAIADQGGRSLQPADRGRPVAVLGAQFAHYHDLPNRGHLQIGATDRLSYVGLGTSPQDFLTIDQRGIFLTQGSFALVYVPLETAQRVTGEAGAANDVAVRVARGAPVRTVEREITAVLRDRFPDVGVTVTDRRDDPTHRQLYDSIPRHQRLFGVFAVLVLLAAGFVAFNFAGRLVQAQRREIGIGMALGVPPRHLAIRPLLVAAQLALVGVLLGVGVGVIMSIAMASILRELTPLPEWHFPVQLGLYAQGAALAFAVPIVAALIPVWRAVRVTPVQAIRTDGGATIAGRPASFTARLPLPLRTTARVPVRNLLRVPFRTLMTSVGIAVAITVLVGLLGLIDSFFATADAAEAEGRRGSADLIEITLDSLYAGDSAQVRSITDSPLLGHVELGVQAAGAVSRGRTSFDVLLELRDLDDPRWAPTIEQRQEVDGPGIVLTDAAAQQLGVGPGNTVTVRHPRRQGTSYGFAESRVAVLGTNPFPVRGVAYLDISAASLGRVQGLTNLIVVTPARGASVADVQRYLLGSPAVASVQPVLSLVRTVRAQLDRVFAAIVVVEAAVLLLVLLIAYSAARINADERVREDATMLAFGFRLPRVVRMAVAESLMIGLLGTALGLGAGLVLLDWLVHHLLRDTIPDIGIVAHVDVATVLVAFVLGVVAVAAAPVPNALRLRRMDLPEALRIVE